MPHLDLRRRRETSQQVHRAPILPAEADAKRGQDHGGEHHHEGEEGDHGGDRPGERAVGAAVGVLAHQLAVAGHACDEDEQHWQQEAIDGLHHHEQADDGDGGEQGNGGAEDDQRGNEAIEERRLANIERDATLPAEGLADGEGGGQRQHAGGEHLGAVDADAEELRGEAPGNGRERSSGLIGGADLNAGSAGGESGGIERGGGGNDDEDGNQVREDAAHGHIQADPRQLAGRQPLLHHGVLLIHLHVRGDGGADGGDEEQDVLRIGAYSGHDRMAQHLPPIWMGEHGSDGIGEEDESEEEEDAFDAPVAAANDEPPHGQGHKGNDGVAAEAEEFSGGADADELGDGDAAVGDEQAEHSDDRPTRAEALANEVGKAFAGHGTHASALLLHRDHGKGDDDHHPDQVVARLRAHRGIGGDPTDVIAGAGGD